MKMKSVATTAMALATTIAALAGSTTAGAAPVDVVSTQSVTPTQQLTSTTKPVSIRGDFDGDGRDDIFWYVAGAGADSLWSGKGRDTTVTNATADRFDIRAMTINGTYAPIVGDFDGNGLDDIFWYGRGSLADSSWFFTGRGTYTSKTIAAGGSNTPIVANFNNDTRDDIFWYSPSGTTPSLWLGNTNQTFTNKAQTLKPPMYAKVYAGNWRQTNPTNPASTAFTDLLFYLPGTGADAIWTGNGTGAFTTSAVTINGKYDPIVGNFNTSTGPDLTDIFWYAPGTNPDSVWINNGSGFSSTAVPVNGTTYKPVVMTSKTPGNPDDILWNNPSGADYIWQSVTGAKPYNYLSRTPSQFGATDPGTRTPIVGDYDSQAASSGDARGGIKVGFNHVCALTSAGGVKCWGHNAHSQLGNQSVLPSSTPVQPVGLSSGVASIATSPYSNHTCAVTTTATVKCWGQNGDGEAGGPTGTNVTLPTLVPSLSNIASVATMGDSTCALSTAGGVKCWGYNVEGQLGNGTESSTTTLVPTNVVGLTSGVTAISGGYRHMCALTTGGVVKCWGRGDRNENGLGTLDDSGTPAAVVGLPSGITSLTAGDEHSCAITAGGGAMCWGHNASGQLGNGTTSAWAGPQNVSGLGSNVTAIAPGSTHSCATVTSGAVLCWGQNDEGQIGNGTDDSSWTPVVVPTLSGAAAISSGYDQTCALVAGTAKCWGSGANGKLGNGATADAWSPVSVSGGATWATGDVSPNLPNADILWWAPGITAAQSEQLWLELENL